MNIVGVIFWFIVILVILVLVHELGHFLAARGFGVRVTEFMIGLPGPNIGFERKGCRYGITCIPLGGYNRITGMEGGPEDPNLEKVLAHVYRRGTSDIEHVALACGLDRLQSEQALTILDGWGSINAPGRSNKLDQYAAPKTEEYTLGQPREVDDPKALLDEERKHTYRALSCWKRLVVLLAGPIMNILLAFILFIVIFSVIGLPRATTTISGVTEGGPAAMAGMQAGDTIVAVNGADTSDWQSLVTAISSLGAGDEVTVEYMRDGVAYHASLTVAANEDGSPQFGIYAGQEQYRLPIGEALVTSWQYFVLTVQAYINLFNPATAGEVISQSTSIVGIAVISERAASVGVTPLLYIIAVVSLSLGIVNLLPLPPLDGGKIVVEIIQRITRKDIPVRVINGISVAVIVLLMLLFVVLLRQDIVNFVLGG